MRAQLYDRKGEPTAWVLFDDEDLDLFCSRNWYRATNGYVVSYRRGEGTTYLHRFLFGLKPGDKAQVDHRDNDPLNNCRSNLRLCVNGTNSQNRSGAYRTSARTSRYRGVYWDKAREKWHVQVTIDGKNHHLGRFDTEEQAGEVAAAFRRAHMPFSAMDMR